MKYQNPRHRVRRHLLVTGPPRCLVVGVALLAVGWAVTGAQPAEAQSQKTPAAQKVEVEALKTRLGDLTHRIQILKREPRNVKSDFELRHKMADAEELGRRITALEKRWGHTDSAAEPSMVLPQESPSDGPAERAAKADILLDQALRLTKKADRLRRFEIRLRQRDTLTRRMGRLQSDPFVALETSKRRLAFSSPDKGVAAKGGGDSDASGGPTALTGGDKSTVAPAGDRSSDSAEESAAPATAPMADQQASAEGSSAPGVASKSGEPAQNDNVGPPSREVPGITPTAPGAAPDASASFVTQFRALLDPQTLAQIEGLHRQGTPRARAEAMRKASEALQRRAASLKAQAERMRAPRK